MGENVQVIQIYSHPMANASPVNASTPRLAVTQTALLVLGEMPKYAALGTQYNFLVRGPWTRLL